MSGGSEYDTGGENCYQVEKHLHAPANFLMMSLGIPVCGIIFFLIIEMIFLAQGADTWNVWPRVWKLHGKLLH